MYLQAQAITCHRNLPIYYLIQAIATGDEGFHERLDYVIKELNKVQEASQDGYLSAFPKEHFVRLQALQAVWAPFYVVTAYTYSSDLPLIWCLVGLHYKSKQSILYV